jgi:hypothetical protein
MHKKEESNGWRKQKTTPQKNLFIGSDVPGGGDLWAHFGRHSLRDGKINTVNLKKFGFLSSNIVKLLSHRKNNFNKFYHFLYSLYFLFCCYGQQLWWLAPGTRTPSYATVCRDKYSWWAQVQD